MTTSLIQFSPLRFQSSRQLLLRRQSQLVLARENLVAQLPQSIVRRGWVVFLTEDQADRWVLMRVAPMLPCIIQIQIHLPASACVNLPSFNSMRTRDRRRRWKNSRSRRYHSVPTRSRFWRATNENSMEPGPLRLRSLTPGKSDPLEGESFTGILEQVLSEIRLRQLVHDQARLPDE